MLCRYQPSQEVVQLVIHFCRSASESIGAVSPGVVVEWTGTRFMNVCCVCIHCKAFKDTSWSVVVSVGA